ncbi:MAG: four helix bundle protein [Gemmatimonadaceae bacterium]
MEHPHPDFPSFELAAPSVYAGDPLWNVRMFRMASYLSGRARTDAVRLGLHSSLALADQFVRAIGSIAANIAEGYSRDSDADRRRFYGYALGSTREAIAWLDGTGLHDAAANAEYVDLLVQIRRQLLTTMKRIGRPEARGVRKRGAKPA